ncbi:N-acetylmannosamine-6-phosphate 2-epimerase [Parablautia sp. Marseille-Q6255]|uniref:N-acetylmannosamine-6-phosphate 2-epimerase n=1 Tax=Parablautia sp. Marseille-Q6255 TaxID=3039593 RepID=UPI0024BD4E4A|nr:N-acetylmannosamine-6-phosphate 2-epimerase [Parablautia sp. Marseille-Q6255]
MKKEELFERIRGKVIVSCQAVPGEPLYVEEKSVMYLMARAAKQAGTPMIRTSSIRDVLAIKEETGLPVIGLVKVQYEGFESYITPTMKEVDDLVAAGSDIIALDCTQQKRGDGKTVSEFITEVRTKYPDAILMADISTYEEGIQAWKLGMDIVGTTMSGYTSYTEKTDGPDYELVKRLAAAVDIPVIGEGRIHYPQQAVEMLDAGAFAVVVGGAITRPLEIAQRFISAVDAAQSR